MRQIIRRREIVEDELLYPGEPDAPGKVRVSALADWIAAARASTTPVPDAVLLTPADDVEALADGIAQLRWIVIEFPKIGEGRGFSQARLLRQRHGYGQELRARGALKRDQMIFLARSGFDAFDLDPSEDPKAALAALGSFSVAYQGGDDRLVRVRHRS